MEYVDSYKYILHARLMVMEDKYDKAFDILLAAFKRIPSLIPIFEEEFCSILLMLNTMFAESSDNHITPVFVNFIEALKIFPKNTFLLNDFGKFLYKCGFYKEALEQFEEVLQISPTNASVEKNINSVKNLLVARWHFRMLNDNLRNESYRQAIHQVITQKDRVLDVGTGTGLLGIYACEAGASQVVGCECSEIMCNVAKKIINGHKINKITVINKMSTHLKLRDLGGRFSKLVTEMFDAGLFGEHVLQMLSHAWPTLLLRKAVVVPNTVEFFVMGVQCGHLSKNYKLGSEAKSLLNIPLLNVHICSQDESYDSEDVHLVKDIKYLTEPKSVLKINLNNLKDIKRNLRKTDPYKVDLIAKENGQMNNVIGWFNLYLTDSVRITTDPRAPDRANAWQQAIFFDDIPKTVQENELIHLNFLMNGGQLTMVHSSDNPITRVSPEVIRFLNDTEYIKMIRDCFSIACEHLVQIKEISAISIVDLCPFPLFGLLMLKHGAKSLTCCATNELNKDFIMKVFLENEIAQSKVSVALGDALTIEAFEENCYHAIFSHSLELCGDVLVERELMIQNLRCHKLVQGGLFLPQQVSLVAQLVSSHWLDLNNRLYDKNVTNYGMATHLNKYTVSQNFDIDFSMLKYVPISEPNVMWDCADSNSHEEKLVKIISDGYANAILCWYNIRLTNLTPELSTNRPNSFMNGTLYLTYSKQQLIAGNFSKIIQYKDKDGTFKLVMEPV